MRGRARLTPAFRRQKKTRYGGDRQLEIPPIFHNDKEICAVNSDHDEGATDRATFSPFSCIASSENDNFTMDFKAHFASFCTGDNQSCSYEDWIDALTSSQQMNDDDSSSNASSSTTSAPTDILLDFEGIAKVIDPKYYSEDCEERKF